MSEKKSSDYEEYDDDLDQPVESEPVTKKESNAIESEKPADSIVSVPSYKEEEKESIDKAPESLRSDPPIEAAPEEDERPEPVMEEPVVEE